MSSDLRPVCAGLLLAVCMAAVPCAGLAANESLAMPTPAVAQPATAADPLREAEALLGDGMKPAPAAEGAVGAAREGALADSPARQYLDGLDLTGKRDPFSEMGQAAAEPKASSWWNQAGEGEEREFKFDGSSQTISSASLERLPQIKVTGIMQVGSRRAVCACIQDKKSTVLHENDRIVLDVSVNSKLSKWLVIKQIHRNGMTVILDDGLEVTGKFY